jgi:hypothetical protein
LCLLLLFIILPTLLAPSTKRKESVQ